MNRVEEMMDLMKAHDLRELKEFFNKKEEEQKKICHYRYCCCCSRNRIPCIPLLHTGLSGRL